MAMKIKSKYPLLKNLNTSRSAKLRTGSWWLRASTARKKRKDCISMDVLAVIKEFYCDGSISRTVPDKRAAHVVEGEYQPSYVMTCTLRETFDIYTAKHPGRKLGFTTVTWWSAWWGCNVHIQTVDIINHTLI